MKKEILTIFVILTIMLVAGFASLDANKKSAHEKSLHIAAMAYVGERNENK